MATPVWIWIVVINVSIVRTFVIPPEHVELAVSEQVAFMSPQFYSGLYLAQDIILVQVDEAGVPIVRFLPRREGPLLEEVWVKPAKVAAIPLVDTDTGGDKQASLQNF